MNARQYIQLDLCHYAFANKVLRECFGAGFNDFLIVKGNKIRNMNKNRLKWKQVQENAEKEDENSSNEGKKMYKLITGLMMS